MTAATLPIIRDLVRDAAHPLTGASTDYDPLVQFLGGAHYGLLGEASHGTHEFFRQRAQITKRLIQERGFTEVAVEADWPDAYRVNKYLRGQSEDEDAVEAPDRFKRFSAWMWRNADVLDFIGWLRAHNDSLPSGAVSLHASIEKDAEQYCRTMFRGRVSSWNLRDRHMVETLDSLSDHLALQGPWAKIALWAHISHLGDARAIQMGETGEQEIGEPAETFPTGI